MLPRGWRRNGWTAGHVWWGVALIAVAVAAAYEAWLDMAWIIWRDEEASHALLVPVIAAWLVWVRRRRLRQCQPMGQWIGPAVVLLGCAVHLLGDAWVYQVLWHGGALIMVVGAILTVAGRDVLRHFLPAFAVCVFILPVPGRVRQAVAIPLETVTAQATQACFSLAGVAAERSGNMLTINGEDVAIAEACNGLRMLFALAAVSYAFVFGTPLRNYARVLVLLACPVSAVVCNVIRLVPTVWLYARYPGEFSEAFHTLSGWAMLLGSFLVLMGTLRLLRWALIPVNQYTLAYD